MEASVGIKLLCGVLGSQEGVAIETRSVMGTLLPRLGLEYNLRSQDASMWGRPCHNEVTDGDLTALSGVPSLVIGGLGFRLWGSDGLFLSVLHCRALNISQN